MIPPYSLHFDQFVAWDDSDAEIDGLAGLQLAPFDIAAISKNSNGKFDLQAWNDKQKGDALLFCKSDPGGHLLVARIALQPQAKYMGEMERIASKEWGRRQVAAALSTGRARLRIQDCICSKTAHRMFLFSDVGFKIAVLFLRCLDVHVGDCATKKTLVDFRFIANESHTAAAPKAGYY